MNKRKIILLSLIAIFAVVYILQIVFSGGTQIKDFNLEDEPDAITITSNDVENTIRLVKDGENWFINDEKYLADATTMETILQESKNIRSLGTVSKNGDDARYGVDEESAILVTLYKDGKELRKLRIGKAAATGQQTYIQLDDKKDVMLISGNITYTFLTTVEELRDKNIFMTNVSDIMNVSVSTKDGSFKLQKSGEPAAWTLVEENGKTVQDGKLDAEKTGSWINGLASLRAQSFAEDNLTLPTKSLADFSMNAAGKDISMKIYEAEEEGEYLVKASESPYAFYVSSYTAERYMKKLSDIQ